MAGEAPPPGGFAPPTFGMGSVEARQMNGEARPPAPDLKAWAADAEEEDPRAKASRLRPGDSIGSSRVPFEVADREAYLAAVKAHGSVAAKTHGAPIALVNLRDLKAIQETVNDERLHQHLESPGGLVPPGARGAGHGGLVDRPVVVRLGGELFIHDGHHRLTAAQLRGLETAKVRLVDLDGEFPSRGAR